MHIDSEEFTILAERLAARRGASVEEALTELVRSELAREGALPEGDGNSAEAEVDEARRARAFQMLEERIALLPPKERDERRRSGRNFLEMTWRIQKEVRALPVLDPRPIDELLYDEDGLPK